ncbi:MAG: hypothetical protein C5B57_01220 [Blastocatellia bacterium]|nr:MAG: hypothetical protein C5B57_01220 [Blastocatellia bacterium]
MVVTRPLVGWLEIHPENFLANPHATELLLDLARDYPISVHTVGISIGSADGIDRDHLRRVASLVERLDPVLVSGHIAWSSHGGQYLNDLLPLPYTPETVAVVAEHLHEVQDTLGRPYLLENPSTYVGFGHSTMTEVEFLNALVERTGCQLLCDVSNVYLSGHNMKRDPLAYIDALPGDAVAELHLGGFTAEEDDAEPGATLLVDTHAARIDDAVWPLHAHALQRFGRRPVLIEWDADLPAMDVLVSEAHHADRIASTALDESHATAR